MNEFTLLDMIYPTFEAAIETAAIAEKQIKSIGGRGKIVMIVILKNLVFEYQMGGETLKIRVPSVSMS